MASITLVVLCTLVGALGVCSFALACQFPIYTDEITWKAILGRLDVQKMHSITVTLQPACVSNYVTRTPLMLLPARWIDTWLYKPLSTPLRMRMWGVGLALLWLALSWRFLCSFIKGLAPWWEVGCLLTGWATLGVMPFLLVLGRPEQILLLGTTVLLFGALKSPTRKQVLFLQAGLALGTVLLTYYLLCAHPRGVLLLPLAFACLYRRISLPWLRWFVISATGLLGLYTQRAWRPLWSCTGDPQFAALLSSSNFGTAYSAGLAKPFLLHLSRTLLTPGGWFLKEFVPKADYTASMIPPFLSPLAFPLRVFTECSAILVLVFGLTASLLCIVQFLRKRLDGSVVFTLWAGWFIYFVSVGIRLQKNDYEAALFEPLIGLLACTSVLTLLALKPDGLTGSFCGWVRRRWTFAKYALLLLSVISQAALLLAYRHDALHEWREPGQTPGQLLSVNVANFGVAAQRIRHAAALCGISPDRPVSRLVLDEPSSFVFYSDPDPLFALIFDDRIWGAYRPDPTSLLKSEHSAGFVAACNRLPLFYQGKAIHDGQFCCLPDFYTAR